MAAIGSQQYAILSGLRILEGEATTQDIYRVLLGHYEPLSITSISVALDRMRKHGLVTARKGDPLPHRGGKARIHYTIVEKGREALLKSEKNYKSSEMLRSDIPVPIA